MSSTQPGVEQGPAEDVITAEGPAAGEAAAEEAAIAGAPELVADSVGEYTRIWLKRIRSGESGALPIVIGLIAIVIFFQAKNSLFLSAGNLVNLLIQGAPFVLLGMAEVWVLLLGEIDLSVGYNAGIGAVACLWAVFTLPWSDRHHHRARRHGLLRPGLGRADHQPGPALLRGHPGRPARPAGIAAVDGGPHWSWRWRLDHQPQQHHLRPDRGKPEPRGRLDPHGRGRRRGRVVHDPPRPPQARQRPGGSAARRHVAQGRGDGDRRHPGRRGRQHRPRRRRDDAARRALDRPHRAGRPGDLTR